jgi:integrase
MRGTFWALAHQSKSIMAAGFLTEGARIVASVFKVTIVQHWLHNVWLDADSKPCDKDAPGARFVKARKVPAGTPGAKKVKKKSKKWYGRVPGDPTPVPLATNKVAAEQMQAELVRKAELRKVNICDPFEEHSKRPLVEHLTDFRRDLEARGNSQRYTDLVSSRLGDLLSGCCFRFTSDLSASRVMDWLAELRRKGRQRAELELGKDLFTRAEVARALGIKPASVNSLVRRHGLDATGNGKARRFPRATVEALLERLPQGVSVETTNQYLTHLKSFCNWMVKDRRTPASPIAHLEPGNADVDRRHDRRELDAGELRRLLAAARDSTGLFRGLTGRDRYHLYAVACGTGFRAAALASLTPESFDLENDPPTVTLAARRNKSRKLKVQPLPLDVAELISAYLTDKPAGQPVWGGTWARDRVAAMMLRRDLEAAGIPYVLDGPDGPLYADFHALRHSYLTLGGRSGIDLRTLQELAGHSTPLLTARYSHRRLHDLAGAVEKLPRLLPDDPPAEALRATGTDGAARFHTSEVGSVCTGFVQTNDPGRDSLRLGESVTEGGRENQIGPNPLVLQGVEANQDRVILPDFKAGDRIRTGDVQLGKLGNTWAEKCRTPLLHNSLRGSPAVCKLVRRLAKIHENMQIFCIRVSGMQKNAETDNWGG